MTPALPPRAPALLKWISATSADPLALAVTNGARLDDRTAMVASNGLVAKVDLERGTIVELVTYEEKRPARPERRETCGFCGRREAEDRYRACEVAHAGRDIWFFCPWTGSIAASGRETLPFGVLAVRGGSAGLVAKPVRAFEIVGRGPGRPLVSSSLAGGVFLAHPCNFDDRESGLTMMCVRQPDGSFSNFVGALRTPWPNDRLPGSQPIPLADGRVAAVFGAYAQGSADAKPIRVELLGPGGDRTSLPPMPIALPTGASVEVKGAEESDGSIDLALLATHWPNDARSAGEHEGPVRTGWLVRQPLDGRVATTRAIAGASIVAVGSGHAIAVVEGSSKVLLSNDGGATVVEEDAPGTMRRLIRATVNDVGALIEGEQDDGWLRVGWGPIARR